MRPLQRLPRKASQPSAGSLRSPATAYRFSLIGPPPDALSSSATLVPPCSPVSRPSAILAAIGSTTGAGPCWAGSRGGSALPATFHSISRRCRFRPGPGGRELATPRRSASTFTIATACGTPTGRSSPGASRSTCPRPRPDRTRARRASPSPVFRPVRSAPSSHGPTMSRPASGTSPRRPAGTVWPAAVWLGALVLSVAITPIRPVRRPFTWQRSCRQGAGPEGR